MCFEYQTLKSGWNVKFDNGLFYHMHMICKCTFVPVESDYVYFMD